MTGVLDNGALIPEDDRNLAALCDFHDLPATGFLEISGLRYLVCGRCIGWLRLAGELAQVHKLER